MAKILIVEDDLALAKTIKEHLADERYVVECLSDGSEAFERLRFYSFDLLVLDWNVPNMSGMEICRAYRKQGGKTPILMLTGRGKIEEKQVGFESGADDYLTKPFDMRELSMRVQALLRRPHQYVSAEENVLRCGALSLHLKEHFFFKGETKVHLVPKEYALLQFFLTHPNEVFSPEAILERVWPSHSDMSPESVRMYISRLRTKIDSKNQPSFIQTVHGLGYKLVPTAGEQG